MFFHFSKFIDIFFKNTKGQKRKFLIAGNLNILITNTFLQIFLFSGILSLSASTLFSQIINMILGYIIYSKKIFNVKEIFRLNFFLKYLILMIILWQCNFYGIKFLIILGISKFIAAIIFIPLLALTSFIF